MSEQENLKLVQQFYAAFKTGNINGVLSTLVDDVGWSIPGPKDIVLFVGQRQGHDKVTQAIAKFAEMQRLSRANDLPTNFATSKSFLLCAAGHCRMG